MKVLLSFASNKVNSSHHENTKHANSSQLYEYQKYGQDMKQQGYKHMKKGMGRQLNMLQERFV